MDINVAPLSVVAEKFEIMMLMVANDDALHDVLNGENRIIEEMATGTMVINSCMISHKATESAAICIVDAGGQFVGAPVSGTVETVEEGTLTILAAGNDGEVNDVRPIQETIGDLIIDYGDSGQEMTMKPSINLLPGGDDAKIRQMQP